MSGVWFAIAALCGVVSVVIQSVTTVVVALVSLTAGVVALFAGRAVDVRTTTAKAAKPRSGRGKTTSGRSPAKPGTGPKKPQKCSIRCRRSTKDPQTCDCACKGRSHGSEAGRTYANSRAGLKSRTARKQEKRHVKRVERAPEYTPTDPTPFLTQLKIHEFNTKQAEAKRREREGKG